MEKPSDARNESLRSRALENKVFYFDFKNSSTANWLEKEIRKLGGRVEYFFGKEVQYLITDKPATRESIPPCSPFSNPGPSPFSRPDTSQSMNAGPTPSEWAYSDQWKKPQASSQRSRASKLMELASFTKSQGSCDVLSRAKERGTTIKTVEQITSWLNTVHKKLGTKMSRDNLKEEPKNPSRKLRGQYMKVEDKHHKYKPQILDDAPAWQTIDCRSHTDESPFNTEKRRLTRKQAHTKPSKTTSIKSILKKEVPLASKKKQGLIRRKGGGKCEGCNVRFDNLEVHLSGDQHGKYAKKEKHFEAIDQLMSDGLSLDSFLLEQQKYSASNRKPAVLSQVMSPQSDGSTTEPLDVTDGPCTRARKQKCHDLPPNNTPLAPRDTEPAVPSPKVAGIAELENNYYLRSTPRKLVGMLDQWGCSLWDGTQLPEGLSQASLVSDGTALQCHSLDLYSSQEQITRPDQPYEFVVKRPKMTPNQYVHRPTRSNSPARRPTRSQSPARGTTVTPSQSPACRPTRSQSPPRPTRSQSPARLAPRSPARRSPAPPSSVPHSPAPRTRNNSARQTHASPSNSAVDSPSKRSGMINSPSKRSPRIRDCAGTKRRVTNHS